MLKPLTIPGLFVTGTDTGVGKTIIAAGIADWFRRRKINVAVCKPAATGCPRRREGLVSEDAEILAQHADAKFPLDVICPRRFAEPLAPAVAAQRAGEKLDWAAIQASLNEMSATSDCMIVEGIGGVMVPMDDRFFVLDMIEWLRIPAVVVARPSLGTINHTLLTLEALRSREIPIVGVVINQYPSDTADAAEETNPRAIEKWGKTRVLALAPKFTGEFVPNLPAEIVSALEPIDWKNLMKRG